VVPTFHAAHVLTQVNLALMHGEWQRRLHICRGGLQCTIHALGGFVLQWAAHVQMNAV
jgi:hypothetical protein